MIGHYRPFMACFAVMAMLGGIVNARERSGSAVLPSGPVVVAIAPATALSRDLQSDAYGDYAEYLNSFAANRPAGLKVVRLSLAS